MDVDCRKYTGARTPPVGRLAAPPPRKGKRMIGSTVRQQAVSSIVDGKGPVRSDMNGVPADKLFGTNVFGPAEMKAHLPKDVYRSLKRTIERGATLDPAIADVVASAMKDWAVSRGATHYAHVFYPLTGLTAEKHDSFL